MSFQVQVCLFLLFGAPSVTGNSVDCASSNASFEVKKVYLGETLVLDVETDHDQAHVLVLQVSSTGEPTPLMSVNADPNSVPNLTFWGNSEMGYANRTTVKRTATKPGEQQNVSFTIRPVEYGDGDIYSVEVENAHTRVKKCFQVNVHGPPSKPELTVHKGNATEVRFARVLCSSTCTTSPRNPDCPLTYRWTVNDNEINPVSDFYSRFMVRDNELMIAGLTEADDNMRVTCDVQEENGHPNKASRTVVLSVPSVRHANIGRSGRHSADGVPGKEMGMDCNCAGWIGVTVTVLCIALIIIGFCVAAWCKRKRQGRQRQLRGADEETGTNQNETGSMILDPVDDLGGANG